MEALWKKEMSGGTASSGFIQAMMGRESNNPEVQAKFQRRVDERNAKVAPKRARGDKRVKDGELTKEFLNEQKFQSRPELLEQEGFDINKMSKATHDLMRHKKLLTVDEAIKRFYDFLKKHAPQHQPLNNRPDKPLINYRGAYDIANMFDRFTEEEEVEVEDEKDEDDGKYDDPEPSKYAELIDLIKQSNDNKIQVESPEHRRMYSLYRVYKADEDDETELPYFKHRTETLLRYLRYMSPKEQRGEDLTLEEAKALLQKDEEANRKSEENLRQLREDMKKQEEKNKRYRIEEAKAKRGEKPSDEFIHTVLGTIYREALKAKEKK